MDRPLSPPLYPTRRGQSMIPTECGVCKQHFSEPSGAAKHARKHPKLVDKGGVNRPARRTYEAAMVHDVWDTHDCSEARCGPERMAAIERFWGVQDG